MGKCMQNDSVLNKIEGLATEIAKREGCLLYDVEFLGSPGGRILRVYIDKEGSSVSVDDCANVSRALNLILDVEDIIPGGAYNLEVSSPGLERQMRKPWHFRLAIGKKVWMKLNQPLADMGMQNPTLKSAKQFTQVLSNAGDEAVEIEFDQEKITIPVSAIEKAKVVFEFGEKGKNIRGR